MTCEAPGCANPLPPYRRRFCSDACRRRGRRAERTRDHGEYAAGAVRMIRAVGQRAASNPAEFAALWAVRDAADDALVTAVDGLRAAGYPWEYLAELSGVTRQGLAQWRARRDETDAIADARATREHMRRWADGDEHHPGERNDPLTDEAMP